MARRSFLRLSVGPVLLATAFLAGCQSPAPQWTAHHSTDVPPAPAPAARPPAIERPSVVPAVVPVSHQEPSPSPDTPHPHATLSDQAGAAPTRSSLESSPATAGAPVVLPCPTCPPTAVANPSWGLDMAARGSAGNPWRPPGIVGPWPRDEYICDGGDTPPSAGVTARGRAVGLTHEDTIVQYETVDGQARIQASNRVCVYAPRFAAVRKVYQTVLLDQREAIAGVEQPLQMKRIDDVAASNTYVQPLQPGRYLGTKNASRLLAQDRSQPVDNVQAVAGTEAQWLPYEDLNVIRRGVMDNSEKARLAAKLEAAIVWSNPQAVQVVIDGQLAAEASGKVEAAQVLHYKLPDGKRRLRIVKIADRKDAQPGDEISFTLRIDNVGDLPVHHATILDELTPRLEFVDGSAQCSAEHEFTAKPNRGGSSTLRWEVDQAIPVGEGFIIRFRCRVR